MSKFVDGIIDLILSDTSPVTTADQADVEAFDQAIERGAQRVRETRQVRAAQHQARVAGIMRDLDMPRAEAERFVEVEAIMDGSDWAARQNGEQQ